LAGAAFLAVPDSPFVARFRSIFDATQHANAIRLELWRIALAMFRDHPVLGVGPANFWTLFNTYHPGPLGENAKWSQAHNVYLQQLAERGLVGLTMLLTLLAALTWRAYQRYRDKPDFWNLWCVLAMAALWIMNLTENTFQKATDWMMLLLLWMWCERNTYAKERAESSNMR